MVKIFYLYVFITKFLLYSYQGFLGKIYYISIHLIFGGMIRKLPDSVINLISAGQVIQRPYNVIKQLVENSIDAGATQINVNIQQGGLKLIKISDNGNGIMLQDFPLLCARFATSKIKQFSDMSSLNSFGFRGEALASLSYVSNLVISSKWRDDSIGHSATFKNQKLQGKISDVPMNAGTVILAADLFMKLQSRRASLNPSQQKKRIFKLLCHFSLHYPQVRFSLLSQKGDQGIPRANSYSNKNEQKMQVFQQITKLSFDKFSYVAACKLNNMNIQIQAIVTKINSCKGKTLMLNINNRIVDNSDLFKVIQKAYSQCYQSIHEDNQSFWVYLSLKVDPKLIDCNVDPTKKAVGLFASQKAYQSIKQIILNQIKKDSAIKIIKPSVSVQKGQNMQQILRHKMNISSFREHNPKQVKQNQSKNKTIYAFEKNRTDCKQLPLQFYSQTQTQVELVQKYQSFQYQFLITEKDVEIRKFFAQCTYVGCYGLNFILIHFQNKLFMLNIVPFLPYFIGPFCQNNKLTLKKLKRQINIMEQIKNFISKTNLLPESCMEQIKEWISQAKVQQLMDKKFGILIKNFIVIYYPCLGDVFIQCLDQDQVIGWEIAYLICRVFNAINKSKLQTKMEDKFMSEFISSQFIQSNQHLSPFNQKISNFFKNRVIPTLKTSPMKLQPSVDTKKYMKQMLDLKDIYKIFQRC